MVYLLETDLKYNKKLYIALSEVYGIGNNQAMNICNRLGFTKELLVSDLSMYQINKINKFVKESTLIVNEELQKQKQFVNKRLLDIKSYKGIRKFKGYPVRGQRTHTNAKTAKKKF